MIAIRPERPAATNTCRVCAPLGAVLAFRGLRGCSPLIHGSQGCATYIRRYLISHFREPVDVASTSFSESSTVFGGQSNLTTAIANLNRQYRPEVIGVCTTCLAETIGEDTAGMLRRLAAEQPGLPPVIHVPTPSFAGCQHRGFHKAVESILRHVARPGERRRHVTVLPGPVSPADLRHLRELVAAFALPATVFPDYSDTLDGPSLAAYHPVPEGGVGLDELAATGGSASAIQLGATLEPGPVAALETLGVPAIRLGLPIGVGGSDAFTSALAALSGTAIPTAIEAERGRLVDAYVDGHKYVAGKRVAVVGDPDLACALAGFCTEIGLRVVLVASGAATGRLSGGDEAMEDADYDQIGARLDELKPELLLGPSKLSPAARRLGVPLVRVGFPVHDRIGAGRILHLGYRGTQRLFDEVVNALLAHAQDTSEVGYAYQ
jgi:nitrogenase molybdenum-iron protein NifN